MVIIADASFAAILAVDGPGGTNLIQGIVSRNGFTHYVTGNLIPPVGNLYAMRQLANNAGFISNVSRQPAYTLITDTFFGWPVPA